KMMMKRSMDRKALSIFWIMKTSQLTMKYGLSTLAQVKEKNSTCDWLQPPPPKRGQGNQTVSIDPYISSSNRERTSFGKWPDEGLAQQGKMRLSLLPQGNRDAAPQAHRPRSPRPQVRGANLRTPPGTDPCGRS